MTQFEDSCSSLHMMTMQELMPGDVALGFDGDRFKTLLGSCVCVILTEPAHSVAALSHIVHVSQPNRDNAHNAAYGIVAMQQMFRQLNQAGVAPTMCKAYVYGGGNMFPGRYASDSVGSRNVRWVLGFLREQGIRVAHSSLEGAAYRKVSWTVGPADPQVEIVAVEPEASNGN